MIQYFEDLPMVDRDDVIINYGGYRKAAILVYYTPNTDEGRLYAVGDSEDIHPVIQSLLTEIRSKQSPFLGAICMPLYATLEI